MEHPAEHSSTVNHVESHWRTQLRNRIIQASSLLEILLSGLVLIGLLLSFIPLLKWMPGLLFDGNDVEIRTFKMNHIMEWFQWYCFYCNIIVSNICYRYRLRMINLRK